MKMMLAPDLFCSNSYRGSQVPLRLGSDSPIVYNRVASIVLTDAIYTEEEKLFIEQDLGTPNGCNR
jgi:hypothetical protein